MSTVFKTNFENLKLFRSGKVREVYEVENYLLIVAADRISAFDVIMNDPVPGKGEILSEISAFWFNKTISIIPNHLLSTNVDEYPEVCRQYKEQLHGRSMLVKKCTPLAIECIVRGYITGSGWKEYKKSGTVTGIPLPEDLVEFQQLPEPIFTPSTKAETGHDENITFEKAAEIVGFDNAAKIRDVSIELFKFGSEYLEKNNLILADTKFEFGIDENGNLLLIDEALTPDSSRFWLKDTYEPGKLPVHFDKQILRDYLLTLDWDKKPPAPKLPDDVLKLTAEKYIEALRMIVHD
ncbi:phosphoribosylaminoimidazolesuccinocarboxamide synthase [Bacteroidota bacterium]